MQVLFKYNAGNVVRMERVYADILERIKKGAVVDDVVQATPPPAPSAQQVPTPPVGSSLPTSSDGDDEVIVDRNFLSQVTQPVTPPLTRPPTVTTPRQRNGGGSGRGRGRGRQ